LIYYLYGKPPFAKASGDKQKALVCWTLSRVSHEASAKWENNKGENK